jgi:DNA (cytosine-5)-methyltransferase 1
MQDLPEELWHESFRFYVKEDPTRKGGPNLRIIRLDPDQPSLTVTGYIFNKFVHPYENRFITPREAARLQGFPDSLEFKGTLTSVQRQIGDAVPLELGQAIFTSLLNHFSKNWPKQKIFPALSLFSGAGGLDIAAEQATGQNGNCFQTFASVEIESDRCDTLRGYFGEHLQVFNNDITTINAEFVLNRCELPRNKVWLIYGGPPCQSFSQAGKQKGLHDPQGTLIFEFLRFIAEISPPFFVMENVANLKGISKGTLLAEILSEMNNLGYCVDYRILNAAQYGSPQKRRRFIFLGSKKGFATAKLPQPTHSEKANLFGLPLFKTVRQAFEGLPPPDYKPVLTQ